ncbi:hypothetical protein L1887_12523 [Cichorium endivia]|nr:hypothetical protein L1887_12523 [Cichorium endivia]
MISYPTLSRRLFKRGSEAEHQNHKLTTLSIVADLLLEVYLWEALVIWLILFSPGEYSWVKEPKTMGRKTIQGKLHPLIQIVTLLGRKKCVNVKRNIR